MVWEVDVGGIFLHSMWRSCRFWGGYTQFRSCDRLVVSYPDFDLNV